MPFTLRLKHLLALFIGFFFATAVLADGKAQAAPDLPAVQNDDIDRLENGIRRFATQGGLQVALLPQSNPGDRVLGHLKLRYGDEQSLFGKRVVSDMAAAMLPSGTRQSSRQQLSERIDGLGARIAINMEEDHVGIRFEAPRDSLPALLEWLAEVLREPSFPADELDTVRQQAIARLQQQGTSGMRADEELARRTNPYPSGDPRATPSTEEKLAALATLARDDLVRFHADFYGADQGEFALVGNFDAAQARQDIERLLGDWHNRIAYRRAPRPFYAPMPGSVVVNVPDAPHGQYRAMLRVPLRDDRRDALAVALAAQVLGGIPQGGRLTARLNDGTGEPQAGIASVSFSAFEDSGNMRIIAVYPTAQRERLQRIVHEELQQLAENGITVAELQQAKDILLQQSRQNRQNDAAILAQLPVQLRTGRSMQFVAAREAALNAATVDEVNAVIRKHLQPAKLVEVFADAGPQ